MLRLFDPRHFPTFLASVLGLLTATTSVQAKQDPNGFPGPAGNPLAGQSGIPPIGQPGGPEVLTRGPIHEAFATPVVFNPTATLVVPNPPPQTAVEEIPPAQKPAGADVEWIPGYWAWDDQRNDYIWVSGVWRDIPPGRQWIPGYWSQINGGFGWTSGFWAPTQAGGALDYLPAPPASLETGPNSPPPGENFAWAPGSWVWQVDRYAWQPGYWYQAQPDWVWSPSSYQATPSGYVYNQGYWDYSLQRRGLPFAPLAFNNAGFGTGGPISFTPNFVLPVAGLLANLFVRPNYGHYYYGDYYNAAGAGPNAAYVPWFGFQNNRVGYDPIYSSMAALNRGRPNWDQGYRDEYRNRIANPAARPLPTFAAQRAFVDQRRARGEEVRNLGLVEPLNQWASNPHAGQPIVAVNQEHRMELERRQNELTNFRNLRFQQEARGRQASQANQNLRSEEARQTLFRNELPRSPIAAAGNPRFESRGLGAPPAHPPGQNSFRPEFGSNRAEIPVISHRGPEPTRPGGVNPGEQRQREELRHAQEQQRDGQRRQQEREHEERNRGKPR